jgi:hypothetical protein
LINVRADEHGRLRWLRTCAENGPVGYPVRNSGFSLSPVSANCLAQYSVDFEQQRYFAEYKKRNEEMEAESRASMAKEEQAREERHQMLLRSIKISNVKIKCVVTDCSLRSLDFLVTNASQQPVKEISFGWMLLSPQMTACPAQLATKNKEYVVLQPGETAPLSISIFNAPSDATRYCLRVTEIGFPMPWEK